MESLGPYELNQVYAGDAKDLLAELPEACIDLTVTSPPYDNLRDYKGYVFDFRPIAAELFRVTKQGGVAVWVVGDATINGSETGTSFRQALGFMELGFRIHDTMIYHRYARAPDSVRYFQEFEYMFVLSKARPKTTHLLKDIPRSKRHNIKEIGTKRQKDGSLTRWSAILSHTPCRRRGNVWSYGVATNTAFPDHPASFPTALARDHILSWSNPGDVVLDPMCGSGTTLKMAKQLSRKWIGFDISPEYVKLAQKRVSQAQPPLFTLG